jgi:hypothetical protein
MLAKPKLKVWNAEIKVALKEKRNSYNIWLKNGKSNDPTNHLLLQKKHTKKEFRRAEGHADRVVIIAIDLDYRFLCYYLLLWNIMYEIIDF